MDVVTTMLGKRPVGNRNIKEMWARRKSRHYEGYSQSKYGRPYEMLDIVEKNEVKKSWYDIIEHGLAGEYD